MELLLPKIPGLRSQHSQQFGLHVSKPQVDRTPLVVEREPSQVELALERNAQLLPQKQDVLSPRVHSCWAET